MTAGRAEPFTISVDDAVLDDLKARLARTRWPTAPAGPPWKHGAPTDYMAEVVRYWRDDYDWRRWEARLNAIPNYTAKIDGQRIHFMMERGSGPAPMPLVLTHGWPGSVAEFLEVIEPLAHPERFGGDVADAFTVVVPSLLGYAFSDPPPQPVPQRQVAGLWRELMREVLGFPHYAAHAGDMGANLTSWLAVDHPADLIAIHLTLASLQAPLAPGEVVSPAVEAWMADADARRAGELAYQQIQGTKPLSLAYGLTDSPAGLAAWILEKFHGWTVPGSPEAPPFPIDHLLTNVMLHWLPGPGAATWTYAFYIDGSARRLPEGARITPPAGFLLFPQDISTPPPAEWIARTYNLQHYRIAQKGGHFAALENGPLLVDDMRAFFRNFR